MLEIYQTISFQMLKDNSEANFIFMPKWWQSSMIVVWYIRQCEYLCDTNQIKTNFLPHHAFTGPEAGLSCLWIYLQITSTTPPPPPPPPHVWQWHKLAWQDANMLRQFWWGPKTKTQMIFQTKLVRVTIYLSCHSHKCVVQMLERLGKAPTRHRYGESQYRWSNSRRHKLQFCQISS